MLLSGAQEDDAFTLIAQRIRQVAHADTSALVLPSVADTWVCEIADGTHGPELIGTFFPPEGRARGSAESVGTGTGESAAWQLPKQLDRKGAVSVVGFRQDFFLAGELAEERETVANRFAQLLWTRDGDSQSADVLEVELTFGSLPQPPPDVKR